MKSKNGKVILICIILSFLVIVGGICFLVIADSQYECFRNILIHIIEKDNHFNGETWFSAVVSLIGAVISATPGLLCGVFALVQTNKLHEMDARYHRPMLEVEKVKLNFIRISEAKALFDYRGLEPMQIDGLRAAIEQEIGWFIDLDADFFGKNEISVKGIYIHCIDVRFLKEEYSLKLIDEENIYSYKNKMWKYKKEIKDNRTTYHLRCNLSLFDLKNQTKKFWKELEEFVLYRSRKNPEYSNMEMDIYMRVKYEYGKEEAVVGRVRIEFDEEDTVYQNDLIAIDSMNGYFTYDLEGK